RAAAAVAQRVAPLDHEVLDDTVEDRAVVQLAVAGLARGRVDPLLAALGEPDEVLDRLRGLVPDERDDDRALAGGQPRLGLGVRVAHPAAALRLRLCARVAGPLPGPRGAPGRPIVSEARVEPAESVC